MRRRRGSQAVASRTNSATALPTNFFVARFRTQPPPVERDRHLYNRTLGARIPASEPRVFVLKAAVGGGGGGGVRRGLPMTERLGSR